MSEDQNSGVISDDVSPQSMNFVLDAFDATDDANGGVEGELPSAGDEAPVEGKEPQTAAPVQPAQTQAQPAQQPQQPQAQPAQQVAPVQQQPGVQTQQPAQQGQPQPAQAAPGDENAFQALHTALETQRDKFIDTTAKSLEATFTDEDVEEFRDDPRKALSKMGARLHHDIVSNAMAVIAQKLPQELSRMMSAHSTQQAEKEAFFAEYPHLRAHEQQMMPVAQMVRSLNPQADAPTFKKLLAAAAAMAFGAQPQPAAAQPQQRVGQRSFVPAAGRSPQQQPPRQPARSASEMNWAQIDEVIEAQDNGQLNGL